MALEAVSQLSRESLPISMAGKVARLRRLLSEQMEIIQEAQASFLRRYGKRQGENFVVPLDDPHYMDFLDELKAFHAEEFEVDRSFTMEELEKEFKKIRPEILYGLEPLISDD